LWSFVFAAGLFLAMFTSLTESLFVGLPPALTTVDAAPVVFFLAAWTPVRRFASLPRTHTRGENRLSLTMMILNAVVLLGAMIFLGGIVFSIYYLLIVLVTTGATTLLFVLPAVTLVLAAGVV